MLIKQLLLTSDREAMVAVLNDWMLCDGTQLDLVALARLAKLIRLQNGLHAGEFCASKRDQCSTSKDEHQLSGIGEALPYYRTDFGRYKTELCRPFEETGSCKYGLKCQFAHGSKELRTLQRHPKYKTELCRTFHTTGFCPYGPRCHFVHHDGIVSPPRQNENANSNLHRKKSLSSALCEAHQPVASDFASSSRLASLAQLVARIKINISAGVGSSTDEMCGLARIVS